MNKIAHRLYKFARNGVAVCKRTTNKRGKQRDTCQIHKAMTARVKVSRTAQSPHKKHAAAHEILALISSRGGGPKEWARIRKSTRYEKSYQTEKTWRTQAMVTKSGAKGSQDCTTDVLDRNIITYQWTWGKGHCKRGGKKKDQRMGNTKRRGWNRTADKKIQDINEKNLSFCHLLEENSRKRRRETARNIGMKTEQKKKNAKGDKRCWWGASVVETISIYSNIVVECLQTLQVGKGGEDGENKGVFMLLFWAKTLEVEV